MDWRPVQECGYDYECLLGAGCYGSVFKGVHREDSSKKAAIKCINTYGIESYHEVEGEARPVLAEVAMMLRLGTSCTNIIHLHDWMENSTGYILVLEFPERCKTLDSYLEDSLSIDEPTALQFMRQLLKAVNLPKPSMWPVYQRLVNLLLYFSLVDSFFPEDYCALSLMAVLSRILSSQLVVVCIRTSSLSTDP
ncbi:hypothetical protein DNTS_028231 [Danionella cerebrum]|uniref:non-specific serine/threonine protein kinase n=1 Tax=Danionella cerebrum TaxID=2873325 RepID=A0A553QQX9_9TELE|nr:hypothetical protein DNTS_028231 [Danionella translucida]